MEFSGIMKDKERKVERNGIIKKKNKVERVIIKLFIMKIYKIKINRCKL